MNKISGFIIAMSLSGLVACGGGSTPSVTEEVVYPDVTQTQSQRDATTVKGELLVRTIAVSGADLVTDLPDTGIATFVGSASLNQTTNTTACETLNACAVVGNADVSIDLENMLVAAQVYDLTNGIVDFNGELTLNGTVSSDASIAADLSGEYINPAFPSLKNTVSGTALPGGIYDPNAIEENYVSVEGDATIETSSGTNEATFLLIAVE